MRFCFSSRIHNVFFLLDSFRLKCVKTLRLTAVPIVLCFIGINGSLFGQDVPKNMLDTYRIRASNQSENAIEGILTSMDDASDPDLVAHYSSYLSIFYNYIDDTANAKKYFLSAREYWSKAEVNEANQDFFGQHLLGYYELNRTKIEVLDSAAKYIQNTHDLQYIEAFKWGMISPFRQPESYSETLETLLTTKPSIPDALKGRVLLLHMFTLVRLDLLDSVLSTQNQLKAVKMTLSDRLNSTYVAVVAQLDLNKISEAKKSINDTREFLASNNLMDNDDFVRFYYTSQESYYRAIAQYDSAITYNLRLKEIFAKRNEIQPLAMLKQNLADYYRYQEKYVLAEQYYMEAMEMLDIERFKNDIIRIMTSLNKTWLEASELTTDPSEKQALLTKVKDLLLEEERILLSSNLPLLAIDYDAIKARFLTLTGQYRTAENLLNGAIASSNSEGYYNGRWWASIYLAELYILQNKFNGAIALASGLLTDEVNTTDRIKIHQLLMRAHIGNGDTEAALVEFNLISENIRAEDDQRALNLLAEFEVMRDLEREKIINESLEAQQLANSKLIVRQRIIIGIVVFSILIIAFFLVRLQFLRKRNFRLFGKLTKEREELQLTNSELSESEASLKTVKLSQNVILGQLTVHLNKMFNSLKVLRNFIPEAGKLNSEQLKYFERMTELIEEERSSIDQMISLNSILDDHNIDIRRVSINDVLMDVKKNMDSSLRLNESRLEIKMKEDLLFLADRKLIELVFISLIEHGRKNLAKKVLSINVNSSDGLRIEFHFEGASVDDETIREWLKPKTDASKSYFSKLVELKDLMDGDLQYLTIGALHKISVTLNLIELSTGSNKTSVLEPLEIDSVYDQVVKHLVENNGLANSDLNLAALAEKLGIPKRKISFVINTRERTNFSKFLARLRINQVLRKLDNGDHRHLNIAGIGYEAGFNSKSTFFASFKEFVGCTPGEYIVSIDQKAS